jgi:hypothetical protein
MASHNLQPEVLERRIIKGFTRHVHALPSPLTLMHEALPHYEVRGLLTTKCQTQDSRIAP